MRQNPLTKGEKKANGQWSLPLGGCRDRFEVMALYLKPIYVSSNIHVAERRDEAAGYTCHLSPNLSHDFAAKVPGSDVLSLTVLVVPFSLTLEMPASREDSLEYI